MKRISLLLLVLFLTVMAGCAPDRAERPTEIMETEREETTAATAAEETIADVKVEELVPGISTIEDILRYYQAKFPDQEIGVEFSDLDGNGWEDLAVWYYHSYRALYLMEENYVLGKEILFERGFLLLEYWQDENGTVLDTNIIYTIEEENFATIYKYYKVRNGSLYLRDALKYDGTGEHGKCFARNGEEWIPITDEAYRNELGKYWALGDNPKPIEEVQNWLSALLAGAETSDVVLKTMEVPLQDGRVLTLNVMGKQEETTGICGVRKIIVYEGTEVRQSILIEEAIQADGVDGVDVGYSESFSVEESAKVKDVNFDGIPDIEVCGWIPNNSIPYYYWCWDADTEQFVYAFCLQLTDVDYQNQRLISWYKVENGLYYTDYYSVNGQNELELVDRDIEDVGPG